MALTPWRSLWETRLPSLREEIDRLFEDLFGRASTSLFREEVWLPAVDVYEREKDIVIVADLPSVDVKGVSISVVGDRLTLRGERKRDEELRDEYPFRLERIFGTFERTIQLPCEVLPDKAKATYRDGVLKIHIPKAEKMEPREIRVTIE